MANSRQPACYRFDRQTEMSLNVDNLFNKKYRTHPDRHSYGQLRSVGLNFRHSW